jgi:hypothetical protein
MLLTLALIACDGGATKDSSGLGLDSDPDTAQPADCDCAVEDLQTFYLDADGDGHGDADTPVEACEQPDYAATTADDCDDLDAEVWDTSTWYADTDGDGFGDASSSSASCEPGSGQVADATDCDDSDAAVYPGSSTLDDPATGVDGDCDGAVACADADCDGEPDLVLSVYWTSSGGYCGDDQLYYGDGSDYSGVTAATLSNDCSWWHASSDLDQDGYLDLVTVITTDDSMPRETNSHVYWGSATGFSDGDRSDLATTGPVRVLIEDLDGDGHEDLFFSEASSHGNAGFALDSTIYWGDGFTSSTDLPTFGAWDAAASDLDGDGYTDLVVCNYYDDSSTGRGYEIPSAIFWGGSGGFSAASTTELPTAGCRGVLIEDLDQDGLDDLVFANSQDNTGAWQVDSTIYWNSSSGFSSSDTTSLPTSWTHGLTVGDFDGDGWSDLAFGSFYGDLGYDHPAYVYWNSAGSFAASDVTELPGHASYNVEAADLNGDGADELIVPGAWSDSGGQSTTSQVHWGSAHGFCGSDELPTDAPGQVSIGDLDADGFPELLFPAPYGGGGSTLFWGSSGSYSAANSSELGGAEGSWAAPLILGDTAW